MIYPLAHMFSLLFFFNDTATTEIYTLSLHDALPISAEGRGSSSNPQPDSASTGCQSRQPVVRLTCCSDAWSRRRSKVGAARSATAVPGLDRKSTRLNSSHT